MDRNKTSVRIDGHEYVLAGEESEEYMHEVAILVDRVMTEIHSTFENLSTSMVAVLTALNIADELLKERRGQPAPKKKANPQHSSQQNSQQNSSRENVARFNRT